MMVLVTGGTGFFGSAIVTRLREAGHDVVAASRRSPQATLDVADPASCRAVLARYPGTEVVVHAAALAHVPPGRAAAILCQRVNVEGTRNIAQAAAAAGVRRFVFISSITVYGDFDLPPQVSESTPARSSSLYGAAKRSGEQAVADCGPSMDVWILRMSTLYAPDWLFNVRKRVEPPLVGRFIRFSLDSARRRYTLCSRRNGAEAVLWSVEGRLPPGVYNVSESHVYSQGEILRAVERIEGTKPRIRVPVLLPRVAAAVAERLPPGHMRDNARSRYWKFCEHNVYSSSKLSSYGLTLMPDLLSIGTPH